VGICFTSVALQHGKICIASAAVISNRGRDFLDNLYCLRCNRELEAGQKSVAVYLFAQTVGVRPRQKSSALARVRVHASTKRISSLLPAMEVTSERPQRPSPRMAAPIMAWLLSLQCAVHECGVEPV